MALLSYCGTYLPHFPGKVSARERLRRRRRREPARRGRFPGPASLERQAERRAGRRVGVRHWKAPCGFAAGLYALARAPRCCAGTAIDPAAEGLGEESRYSLSGSPAGNPQRRPGEQEDGGNGDAAPGWAVFRREHRAGPPESHHGNPAERWRRRPAGEAADSTARDANIRPWRSGGETPATRSTFSLSSTLPDQLAKRGDLPSRLRALRMRIEPGTAQSAQCG